MLTSLRRSYAGMLTSAGLQVVLLCAALAFKTPLAWRICLGLIVLISLAAWWSVFRRSRLLADTPLSPIATAAQGYVKIQGQGKPLAGMPLLAPCTGQPCLWYRLTSECQEDNRWVRSDTDESTASFLVMDETGTCVVDPEGADMLAKRKRTWDEGDYRHTLWTILEGDAIYAMGTFKTDSTSHVDASISEAVGDLLAQWKQHKPGLLKRFDLNEDGEIDMREWALARAQARREVLQQRQQAVLEHRDLHWLGAPKDGRLGLISALSEDEMANRYAFWVWAQAIIFMSALAAWAAMTG